MRWGHLRMLPVLGLVGLTAACGSAVEQTAKVTKHAGPATVIPASVPAPSTVATAVVPSVKVYAGPATTTKPVLTLSNPNNLGQPLVFLVDKSLGTWLQVYLPHRPNESTGWIPAGDVTLASDNVTVLVQLSQHQVTVMRNGSTVDTIPVAVGDSSGPTPTGNFYVTEVIKVPANQPFFGPYAFGLSAFSNVYHSFDGGPGQTAMHGTDQPSLIGQNVSHGCIRMSNASATRMANEVPLGTPVDITA